MRGCIGSARRIRLGLPGWHRFTVRLPVSGAAVTLRPPAAALETTDTDSAGMRAQFVESCLVDAQVKQIWKELMMPVHYLFRHEVAEQVREQGLACADLDQLETWAQRAVHATQAEDLFADCVG